MLVRSWFPCLIITLSACMPIDERAIGTTRSSLDLASQRIAVGTQGYGLGDALAVCRNGRVVATSTLGQHIWSNDQGFEAIAGLSRAEITCIETAQRTPVWGAIIGTTAKLGDATQISDGGSTRITTRGSLVVTNQRSHLVLTDVDSAVTVDRTTGGLGTLALAITADGGVVVSTVSNLTLYTGQGWGMNLTQVLAGGSVMVVGNVLGDTDEEVIASGSGGSTVRIYNSSLTFLAEVAGPTGSPSFGSALAFQPNLDGGFGTLFIGEPSANRVWRYAGGTMRALDLALDTGQGRFGAALAVEGSKTLYVGDPSYGSGATQGAIYQLDAPIPVLGTTGTVCLDVGDCAPCATACINSECVVADSTLCAAGQVCGATGCQTISLQPDAGVSTDGGVPGQDAGTADAGRADAGSVDGGSIDGGSADGGAADAGTTDAGAQDAGLIADAGSFADAGDDHDAGSLDAGDGRPSEFISAGCASAPSSIWIALAALLFRRARHLSRASR